MGNGLIFCLIALIYFALAGSRLNIIQVRAASSTLLTEAALKLP